MTKEEESRRQRENSIGTVHVVSSQIAPHPIASYSPTRRAPPVAVLLAVRFVPSFIPSPSPGLPPRPAPRTGHGSSSPPSPSPIKITAILVLRTPGHASASASSSSAAGEERQQQAAVLANASDVSRFGFFQRPAAREFIAFVARTVALRTKAGSRQTVQHEEYKVHCYNPNGLCAVVFTGDHYPDRSAHSILIKVLEEYQKSFGESWRTAEDNANQHWEYLDDALTKYQDPAEADKLTKIQRDLDETKIILHETIDSVLQRGERLDSLVAKSSDLSAASQMFYKQAKKTNSCCTIL